MNRPMNRYCTRCLMTRRFQEFGEHYVCESCRKLLHRVVSKKR